MPDPHVFAKVMKSTRPADSFSRSTSSLVSTLDPMCAGDKNRRQLGFLRLLCHNYVTVGSVDTHDSGSGASVNSNQPTGHRQNRPLLGHHFSVLWGLLLLILFVPDKAQAYIDPGAGTIVWQALVAGFLGAVFYLRKLIPGRRSKNDKGPSDPES
jgi:hypothetical protein